MQAIPPNNSWQDEPPPRILIIDDNPSIHRDFELVFMDKSANVGLDTDDHRIYGTPLVATEHKNDFIWEHAYSGLEGIEKVADALAQNRFFQLAFVDIRMPGMDGVETIERLWQIDPKIQVVICTAYADYSQEDLTRRLGYTDKLLLLKKPFDCIEVTQMTRTLTEKWYLARQAALKQEQMELLIAQRTQRVLDLQRFHPPLPDPNPDAKPPQQTEERLPQILLIENNQEVCLQIQQLFAHGYNLIMTQNGFSGFNTAREIVPDLIIADILMPEIDGLVLCRKLKADLVTSHIPVILMALHDSTDHQPAALVAGADDYIVKPFKPSILQARVSNLLESRRKSRARLRVGIPLQPRSLALNQTDARFLQRTIEVIERNLSDFEFDVDALANKVAVSRRQLFRKIKALIDTTPRALLRSVRLKRAAQLLAESEMTITEITFAVGFLDVTHFRTLFKNEFGVLPSEYIKQKAILQTQTAIVAGASSELCEENSGKSLKNG